MAGAWGKLSEKMLFMLGVFLYRPIRFVDLIEIDNENLTPVNQFCIWPA